MVQNTTTSMSTITSTATNTIHALREKLAKCRLLTRGESMIGSVGIVTAAILLSMIGLAGWWTVRGEHEALRELRQQQVRVLGNVISQSAESMLLNNELSGLRRLLIEAKQQHDLTICRIVLPDGRIIADA